MKMAMFMFMYSSIHNQSTCKVINQVIKSQSRYIGILIVSGEGHHNSAKTLIVP